MKLTPPKVYNMMPALYAPMLRYASTSMQTKLEQ